MEQTLGRSDLSAAGHDVAQACGKSGLHITKAGSARRTGRMTGPRTAAGKNRTRYNAIKAGIFSRVALLKDESRTEYQALSNGFRDHFQPQGTFEESLVEKLAMLDWRRKRLICAETAEIESSSRFKSFDSIAAERTEAWDALRAGESAGGMLRKESNPYVLRKAIDMLKRFRGTIEAVGFREGEDYDTWFLEKLYGLDHDGAPPLGLLHSFMVLSRIAAVRRAESDQPSLDRIKQVAVNFLDAEIERLEVWAEVQESRNNEKHEYARTAALVPEQSTIEKFVRYEAHLSREFDRTLNQLDRSQRIRLGQPVLPTLKVDVTS